MKGYEKFQQCKVKLQYEQEDIKVRRASADFLFGEDNREIKYIIFPDCLMKLF